MEQYGIKPLDIFRLSRACTGLPLCGEAPVLLLPRVGLAATRGIDRITPLPVPTHKRSLLSSRAVMRTNEYPYLPVPVHGKRWMSQNSLTKIP